MPPVTKKSRCSLRLSEANETLRKFLREAQDEAINLGLEVEKIKEINNMLLQKESHLNKRIDELEGYKEKYEELLPDKNRCHRCKGLICSRLQEEHGLCYTCLAELSDSYVKRKTYHFKEEINELKEEIENLKKIDKYKNDKTQLKGNFLKDIIFLCHPDKHNNSERSTEVTKFLLNLRNAAPRP